MTTDADIQALNDLAEDMRSGGFKVLFVPNPPFGLRLDVWRPSGKIMFCPNTYTVEETLKALSQAREIGLRLEEEDLVTEEIKRAERLQRYRHYMDLIAKRIRESTPAVEFMHHNGMTSQWRMG